MSLVIVGGLAGLLAWATVEFPVTAHRNTYFARGFSEERFCSLAVGDSTARVRGQLGEPLNIATKRSHFAPNEEAWCYAIPTGLHDFTGFKRRIVMINVADDRVVGFVRATCKDVDRPEVTRTPLGH